MGSPTHSPETRERALLALAVAGGSSTAACAALEAEGIDVSDRTLRDWRAKHAERYAELAAAHSATVEANMIRVQREVALRGFEGASELVEQSLSDAKAGKVKDAAGAARNLATTAAIATDKFLALTGRPSTITEHREPSKLLASLAAKGITVQIGAAPFQRQVTAHADAEAEAIEVDR